MSYLHSLKLLFTGASLFCALTAVAQGDGISPVGGNVNPDNKLLTPSSGISHSMGSIAEPNIYNGTTNINIPIYQYSNAYGNYSVGLTYNTKGVKVDELSGPVGLHWNLAAGGQITRIMKDCPDEINVSAGYDSLFTYHKMRGKNVCYSESPSEASDPTVYRDGVHDDFMVSVGNLNFTFNLGKDGYVFTHPKQQATVGLRYKGNAVNNLPVSDSSNDISFFIVDENRVYYYFRPADTSKFTFELGDAAIRLTPISYNYISRWVIDSIAFPDGKHIKFTYLNFKDIGKSPLYDFGGHIDGPGSAVSWTSAITVDTMFAPKNVSRLHTIQYPNGVTAEMVYDTAMKDKRCDNRGESVLREIVISSGDNCLRYAMIQRYRKGDIERTYGSWNNCNTSKDSLLSVRLYLRAIWLYNCNGTQSEPYYSFSYISPEILPSRLSPAQDFFGYYNARINNPYHKIPSHPPILGNSPGFANRQENTAFMSAGLLNKVTNAYGGYMELQYEAHSFTNPLTLPTDDQFLGAMAKDGVRLKKTVQRDPKSSGNELHTYYYYADGKNYLTGGRFYKPRRIDAYAPDIVTYDYLNTFMSPHQFINGSNQGYGTVRVSVANAGGDTLSKKVYKFTVFHDSMYTNSGGKHYHEFPYSDKQYIKDYMVGLPYEVTEYDQNGRIVDKTLTGYEYIHEHASSSGLSMNTTKMTGTRILLGGGATFYGRTVTVDNTTDSYRPFTGLALPKRVIKHKHVTDATYSQDTIHFTYYENTHRLKSSVARNSKMELISNEHIYPGIAAGGSAPSSLNGLSNGNYGFTVATEKWQRGSTQANDKLLDAGFNIYEPDNGRLLLKKIYAMRSNLPLSFAGYTQTGALNHRFSRLYAAYASEPVPQFQLISEVLRYDKNGNPLEVKLMGRNRYKTTLWDTLTNEKVAEANVPYEDFAFTGFEDGCSRLVEYLLTYRTQVSHAVNLKAMTGKYAYQILRHEPQSHIRIGPLTPGRTYLVSFWSSGAAMPNISGGGLTLSQMDIADNYNLNGWMYLTKTITPTDTSKIVISLPTSGMHYSIIDELRVHPVGAAVNTWSYEPLFGLKSHMDSRGAVILFEYDQFGRQISVRNEDDAIIEKTEYYLD